MARVDLISNFLNNDNISYDFSIKQGKTFNLIFSYPSDLRNGLIRGQIRDTYAQDGGTLLADFSFNITYDEINLKSTVTAYLDANQTELIPYTKYQGQGQGIPNTKNCHVYDIEYKENNNVILLLNGFVEVKPEVTVEEPL